MPAGVNWDVSRELSLLLLVHLDVPKLTLELLPLQRILTIQILEELLQVFMIFVGVSRELSLLLLVHLDDINFTNRFPHSGLSNVHHLQSFH